MSSDLHNVVWQHYGEKVGGRNLELVQGLKANVQQGRAVKFGEVRQQKLSRARDSIRQWLEAERFGLLHLRSYPAADVGAELSGVDLDLKTVRLREGQLAAFSASVFMLTQEALFRPKASACWRCCLLTRQLRIRRGLPSLSSAIPLSSVKVTSCPSCTHIFRQRVRRAGPVTRRLLLPPKYLELKPIILNARHQCGDAGGDARHNPSERLFACVVIAP